MAKGDPCKHCGKPVTVNRGLQCNHCRHKSASASVAAYRATDSWREALRKGRKKFVKTPAGKACVRRHNVARHNAKTLGLTLSEYREMVPRQLGLKE